MSIVRTMVASSMGYNACSLLTNADERTTRRRCTTKVEEIEELTAH